ncbi:alpha/beta hydrolase [Humibacter ginsengisoli]
MGVNVADPGAGEPWGIRALADARSKKAAELRSAHQSLSGAVSDASSGAWVGKTQVAFTSTVGSVLPQVLSLADGLDAQASALYTYAAQVQHIQDQQRTLTRLRSTEQAHLASLTKQQSALARATRMPNPAEEDVRKAHRVGVHIADSQSRLAGIQTQWDDLVTQRRQADKACADAVTGVNVLGATWKLSGGRMSGKTPDQILDMLTGLTPTQLQALLAAHPELAGKIAKADPTEVAAWWNSMNSPQTDPATGTYVPSDAQAALIAGIPAIIGNLNGVAYWARDKANQVVLNQRIAEDEKDPARNADELKALKQVQAAVGAGLHGSVPHELVSLDVGTIPPLAAVAVGDLDHSSHVSFIVPGMNTSVAENLGDYTNAAQEMRKEQRAVSGVDQSDIAVMAWLGYHPPMDDLSFAQVFTDSNAMAAAPRLEGALNGIYAVHNGSTVDVSVIAHSYGTDVAALALTKSHADHLVLLGSPGIAPEVPNASAMNVPSGQVFATQAHHDGWANGGHFLADVAGNPRADPTASSFGSHDFSSEYSKVNGITLNPVTQHGPFAHASGNHSYSYLDDNTTAQFNAARATMGQGAQIAVGDTPSDRFGMQIKDGRGGWDGWWGLMSNGGTATR